MIKRVFHKTSPHLYWGIDIERITDRDLPKTCPKMYSNGLRCFKFAGCNNIVLVLNHIMFLLWFPYRKKVLL